MNEFFKSSNQLAEEIADIVPPLYNWHAGRSEFIRRITELLQEEFLKITSVESSVPKHSFKIGDKVTPKNCTDIRFEVKKLAYLLQASMHCEYVNEENLVSVEEK